MTTTEKISRKKKIHNQFILYCLSSKLTNIEQKVIAVNQFPPTDKMFDQIRTPFKTQVRINKNIELFWVFSFDFYFVRIWISCSTFLNITQFTHLKRTFELSFQITKKHEMNYSNCWYLIFFLYKFVQISHLEFMRWNDARIQSVVGANDFSFFGCGVVRVDLIWMVVQIRACCSTLVRGLMSWPGWFMSWIALVRAVFCDQR